MNLESCLELSDCYDMPPVTLDWLHEVGTRYSRHGGAVFAEKNVGKITEHLGEPIERNGRVTR